jgi:PHP family Zn ribbon phosphoesterase
VDAIMKARQGTMRFKAGGGGKYGKVDSRVENE